MSSPLCSPSVRIPVCDPSLGTSVLLAMTILGLLLLSGSVTCLIRSLLQRKSHLRISLVHLTHWSSRPLRPPLAPLLEPLVFHGGLWHPPLLFPLISLGQRFIYLAQPQPSFPSLRWPLSSLPPCGPVRCWGHITRFVPYLSLADGGPCLMLISTVSSTGLSAAWMGPLANMRWNTLFSPKDYWYSEGIF